MDWVKNENTYNLKIGGTYHELSEESRKKISKSVKLNLVTTWYKGCTPWNKGLPAWNRGLSMGPMSDEQKNQISETLKKRYETEEHPTKGKDPWNKGLKGVQVPWNKGKTLERFECPYCHKTADISNLKRWHLDNCKLKPIDIEDEIISEDDKKEIK